MRTVRLASLALALAVAPLGARAAATFDVQALGGVRAFTDDAGDVLNAGPAYGVGLAVGLGQWVGVEGWYQGATFDTERDLTLGDRRIFQHGVAGILRLGPQQGRVRPYAFGGAEWDWLRADDTNLAVRDDDFLVVPVGAGVDVSVSETYGLKLGARGAYRFGFGEDAFRIGPSSVDRTDQVQVAAVLGGHF